MTGKSYDSIGEPNCPICGGSGFVVKDVEVGHPEFGRAIPCSCTKDKIMQNRRSHMNILGNLEVLNDMTFSNFKIDGLIQPESQRHTIRHAYQAALGFASNPNNWLLLTGNYGVGKTHLAAAIANHVAASGREVVFILVPDLLDHLRSAFSPNSQETYDDIFDHLKNVSLLILDDLGAESSTPWAKEKLFQLLNHRYMRKLPTVITSNRPLETFEPRLLSRLTNTEFVDHPHITALDYRGGGSQDHFTELSELDLYSEKTFKSFSISRGGNLELMRNNAMNYAEAPKGWILLLGRPGVGKTHLAAAIANAFRQIRANVIFVTVPNLMDALRSSFSPDNPISYQVRIDKIKHAELLVIDNISSGLTSEWSREKLIQIIDYRYVTLKPTVFTLDVGFTEKSEKPRELDQLDPRIAARLSDRQVCQTYYVEVLKDSSLVDQQRFSY